MILQNTSKPLKFNYWKYFLKLFKASICHVERANLEPQTSSSPALVS